jgi:hypothetical protein
MEAGDVALDNEARLELEVLELSHHRGVEVAGNLGFVA